MALPSNPQTRQEVYLSNIAGQTATLPSEPHTREEEYLDYIARNGGGGGGGEGDMTKAVYDDDLAVASAGGIKAYVSSAIADKVDKVNGKGLSTNDYDDSAKAIVDGVTSALNDKQPKTLSEPIVVDGIAKFTVETAIDAVNSLAASNKTALQTKVDNSILDGTTIDSFGDVETALASKSDLTNLAPAFSTSTSYSKGQYVTYNGKMYRFISNHSAGAWSIGQVEEAKVSGELSYKENVMTFDSSDFNVTQDIHIDPDYKSKYVNLNKDTTPENGSPYPITSGGVYTALADKVGWDDNAVIGAKNSLPYPYFDKGNKTISGITFIDNGDGEITVKAGTATGNNAPYYIVGNGTTTYGNVSDLPGKILSSGLDPDTSKVYLRIWFYDSTKTFLSYINASEKGVLVNVPTNAVYYVMVLRVENNAVVASDVVAKPMLRPATDTDYNFAPYAKTNKQLTDDVGTLSSSVSAMPRYLETSSKSASSGTDTFTLTDSSITSSTKVLSIVCDKPMVNYTGITVASGQITITYNTSDSVGTVGFLLK